MSVEPSKFHKLLENMPAFSFDAEGASEWLGSGEVQAYLQYYQLDFAHTLEGVQHRFGCLEAGGYRVAMHYWLPELARGTVFVVHGYYDHVGIYKRLIRFLLENRFAVVIFDSPGHGLSSGERATIGSFDEYTEVLLRCLEQCRGDKKKCHSDEKKCHSDGKKCHSDKKDNSAASENLDRMNVPGPWHAVAQSTGGAVVLNYLLRSCLARSGVNNLEAAYREAPRFDRIVLLAPLVRAFGWSRSRWIYELLRHFVKRIPRTFAVNSHDTAFLEFLQNKDPLQTRFLSLPWVAAKKKWIKKLAGCAVCEDSFLVIQGDSDTTVDWRYNTALIQEKFPDSELVIVPGARHQLVNESAPYRDLVFRQLLRYLLRDSREAATPASWPALATPHSAAYKP